MVTLPLIPSFHYKCCYFAGELNDADATKRMSVNSGIVQEFYMSTSVQQNAVQSPLLLLNVLTSCCDLDFSLQTNYTQDKMRKKQKEAENTRQDD